MKEKIIDLYKKGLPIIAITRKLYLSYGYVYNVIRMYERGLKEGLVDKNIETVYNETMEQLEAHLKKETEVL